MIGSKSNTKIQKNFCDPVKLLIKQCMIDHTSARTSTKSITIKTMLKPTSLYILFFFVIRYYL